MRYLFDGSITNTNQMKTCSLECFLGKPSLSLSNMKNENGVPHVVHLVLIGLIGIQTIYAWKM